MWAFLLLQAVPTFAQTWCGAPECGAQPKCLNSQLDLIIAIDESCSMSAVNWQKEVLFATTLANAAEQRFNISRFAGINFGWHASTYTPPVPMSSSIFRHMAAGAAGFTAAIPNDSGSSTRSGTSGANYNCGGTPTDEAMYWFFQELNATRVPGRMQMAVLATDGIPTLCYTTGGGCNGQETAGNKPPSADAAISARFNPTWMPSLGNYIITVGIGAGLGNAIGTTQKYGSINGQQLLTNMATAPNMAFFPADYDILVNQTLQQVLDNLCFYLIDVLTPQSGTCYSGGTLFSIRGYNMFDLGTPKCRWQAVGTSTYLYTTATITATSQKFQNEIGTVGIVNCSAPTNLPLDPFNAILEISRDGTYYTTNEYTVLLRNDCNAPPPPRVCPNQTIANFLANCAPSEVTGQTCSSKCANSALALMTAFGYQNQILPAFPQQQISDCITGYAPVNAPWSAPLMAVVASKTTTSTNPCTRTGGPPGGAASALSISLPLLTLSIAFML